MLSLLAFPLFALLGSSQAAALHPRADSSSFNNVTILALGKSSNSTGGEGNVAAGGVLQPFGNIGVGCGVNWDNGKGYGGGVQAGSDAFGLGGGYSITPTTMQIGAGIGINPTNSSSSFDFRGSVNGTFELSFTSSSNFACVPSSQDGQHTIVCKTI